MSDRTILRPGTPFFAINETAYARVAATKGFIEPLYVIGIEFDPAKNEYLYTFGMDIDHSKPMPIRLYESALLSLCEALDLQIMALERELAEVQEQFKSNCLNAQQQPEVVPPHKWHYLSTPPPPRFGYNEVVYLKETAENVGRLEAFRISNFKWDSDLGQWLYTFHIKRRPERNMTVGDRDNWTRKLDLRYPEEDLCLICEALPIAVNFMQQAVQRAKYRRQTLCPASGVTD